MLYEYMLSENERLKEKIDVLEKEVAYKKYLSLQLEEYAHEKNAIDFYLRHHDPHKGDAVRTLLENPGYQELLSIHPVSGELADWIKEPYERNVKYPEQLIYKAVSGNMVRSKSEVMIDMFLYTKGIPFRYECALTLGDCTLYPDFTIRHPLTGELFYYEHFGMMDVPEYRKHAFAKMQLLAEHQILPGQQLLVTFESRENPLTLEKIEQVLGPYLL